MNSLFGCCCGVLSHLIDQSKEYNQCREGESRGLLCVMRCE